MKLRVLLVCAALAMTGCSQMTMGHSGASSVATGSAGGAYSEGANDQLERCVEPLGTLAVNEDQTANWYSYLGRYGLQSTVPVLRLLAQQSNCWRPTTPSPRP